VAAEARDREHISKQHCSIGQGLVKLWPESQTALKHVQQGILEQLEKVENRYLNNEFASDRVPNKAAGDLHSNSAAAPRMTAVEMSHIRMAVHVLAEVLVVIIYTGFQEGNSSRWADR
jgi:hypothetical protein